jgi:SAM-dependent methyltransferase
MLQDAPYYDESRSEMLGYVPAGARSILDVGCGSGSFGRLLRSARAARLVGIDPVPGPTALPDPYDLRVVGLYPEDVPDERFDCIVFNDVLEHMVDPWRAVEIARDRLDTPGVVIASIPNVRNAARVVRPLLLNGRWRYDDTGILDRSHLRFFTRASARELFERAGYRVERVDAINPLRMGRWAKANRLLRGVLDDFVAEQFAIVARVRE